MALHSSDPCPLEADGGAMSGHGHVIPNENGLKARCGGPTICSVCAKELLAFKDAEIAKQRSDIDAMRADYAALLEYCGVRSIAELRDGYLLLKTRETALRKALAFYTCQDKEGSCPAYDLASGKRGPCAASRCGRTANSALEGGPS